MQINELYSDTIKEHMLSRHNFHEMPDADITQEGKNPSCGDEIELSLKVDGNILKDGAYTGIGCAISQASVSIMIDLVRDKSLDEAKELAELFLKMAVQHSLTEEEMDRLEEAVALQNVYTMPARVKCATMPWHTLITAIEKLSEK